MFPVLFGPGLPVALLQRPGTGVFSPPSRQPLTQIPGSVVGVVLWSRQHTWFSSARSHGLMSLTGGGSGIGSACCRWVVTTVPRGGHLEAVTPVGRISPWGMKNAAQSAWVSSAAPSGCLITCSCGLWEESSFILLCFLWNECLLLVDRPLAPPSVSVSLCCGSSMI